MPSASLEQWRLDRLPRLHELVAQCRAGFAASTPNPALCDENLRGYVLLLSAHFQGFCRDLYSESSQTIITRARPSLQFVVQKQFAANCNLDRGNPNLQNLRADFERFDFTLDLANTDPANPARLRQLDELNQWRNIAAHQGKIPSSAPALVLPLILIWQSACDGLAHSLDEIMYNQLKKSLRRSPWTP